MRENKVKRGFKIAAICWMLLLPCAVMGQDDALFATADSLFSEGLYEELIPVCDAALAQFPDSAFLWYYRGVGRSGLGDDQGALTDLNKAIDLQSGFAEPYVARARIHYGLGDRDLAHKDLRLALKRDEGFLEAYLLRAEVYLDEGLLPDAWNDLEMSRRMAPRDPEVYCLRSQYYLLYGDAGKAVKEAGTAIRLAPNDAMGYMARAMAYEAMGNLPFAKSDVDMAIQLEPLEYSLLNTRAMVLDAMGDRAAALKDIERYMSKDSLAWDAYLTRAWFSMSDSAWTEAEADLLVAQAMRPAEPSIGDQLGYLYILSGQPAKAIAVLDSVVAWAPSLASARANLGYARLLAGDAAAAMKDIQQAIKLDEYEPRAYLYRAAVYHAEKKPAKACEDLDKAVELGFIDYYGPDEIEILRKQACK